MADDPWIVEVTRTVRLVVPATSHAEARVMGLDTAWQWIPENAEGCDQGSASAVVVRTPALTAEDGPEDAAAAEAERQMDRRALAEDVAALHQEFVMKLRAAAPTSAYARKLLLSVDPDGSHEH